MNFLGEFNVKYSYEELFRDLRTLTDMNTENIRFEVLFGNTFELYDPVDETKIERLKKAVKYDIPEGYIQFLRLTDGLGLTQQSDLYEIDTVLYYVEQATFSNSMLPVGKFNSGIMIFIDLTSEDDLYMYVSEPYIDAIAYNLNCDFKQFLFRFVQSNGVDFYDWGADWSKTIIIEAGAHEEELGQFEFTVMLD